MAGLVGRGGLRAAHIAVRQGQWRKCRILNVPEWSLLHRKLHSVPPRLFIIQPLIRSQAGTDSIRSIPTEFEPPPNNSTALTTERSEISPEIPETPTVAVDSVRHEENDSDDDNNSFSFMFTLVD